MAKIKAPITNGMNDLEKKIFSLVFFAIGIPTLIAILFGLVLAQSIFVFVALEVGLLLLWLINAAHRNGEQDHSVFAFATTPTGWVLSTGLSWMPLPRLLGGSSIFQITIAPQATRVEGENRVEEVNCHDGGQVGVDAVLQWVVVDARIAGQFKLEELQARIKDITQRNVRWYALDWDSDEGDRVEPNSKALTRKKGDFSLYIQGEVASLRNREGNRYTTYDGISTKEKFAELGVAAITAEVKDVNPPEEVRDARNQAAAEAGQARKEQLNIKSRTRRALEMMFDGEINWAWFEAEREKEENNGKNAITILSVRYGLPLIDFNEAMKAVRAEEGKLTDVRVDGGGDFTKAAGLNLAGNSR